MHSINHTLKPYPGGGIYLGGGTDSSGFYGPRLFIFRITDPDGKGLSCTQDANFKIINDKTAGAARGNLPLLVNYKQENGDKWYIVPRVPDRARGEQVVFDRPCQRYH